MINFTRSSVFLKKALVLHQRMLTAPLYTNTTLASAKPLVPEFWEKNSKLKRPVSPYVMYKIQLTTVLSITHRITGLGLGLPLYAMGISQLIASKPWASQLLELQATCPLTFTAMKLAVMSGVAYHTFNGVRHLAWDLGIGFPLPQLYASGYFVVALSLLVSSIAAYTYL